jgi:hypothetical protein
VRSASETHPKWSRNQRGRRGNRLGASAMAGLFAQGGAVMATLTEKGRDKLRSNQFAYVDSKGGEHLPIHDESHVRNAMARWNQTEFESPSAKESARRKIVAAAKRHGIEVDSSDNVAKRRR